MQKTHFIILLRKTVTQISLREWCGYIVKKNQRRYKPLLTRRIYLLIFLYMIFDFTLLHLSLLQISLIQFFFFCTDHETNSLSVFHSLLLSLSIFLKTTNPILNVKVTPSAISSFKLRRSSRRLDNIDD